MNITSFLIFTFTLQILFLALDWYVLRNWSRFAVEKKLPNWTHRRLYAVMWLMAAVNVYVNIRRLNSGILTQWEIVVYSIVVTWYLPKICIALVLLFRDAITLLSYIGTKIFTKRESLSTPKIAEAPGDSTPRRDFMKTVAWATAGAPFIVVVDGLARKATDFTVFSEEIAIKTLPKSFDGIKIAHISDLHAGSFPDGKAMQEAIRILHEQKPDIVCITGDFVNFKAYEFPVIAKEISKLHADLGVYGSLGNHDHYMSDAEHLQLQSMIRSAGVNLLVNRCHIIGIGAESIKIAAVDNTGLRQNYAKLDQAMAYSDTGKFIENDIANTTVLLAHDPTFWDNEVRGIANIPLMLSGHTHGGQIGLHALGKEMSFAQIVYRQWAGLYSDSDQHLYVNRGLGVVGPPLRIGIPPEITMLTLRNASA